MGKGQSKSHIVIFVEGDTDQIFFEGLLEYYRNHSSTPVHSCEVKNLKGVSRYTSKVIGKLKYLRAVVPLTHCFHSVAVSLSTCSSVTVRLLTVR